MTPVDLRTKATRREAENLAGAARRLERRSRGTPLETAAAATQALFRDAGIETPELDATLSVVDEDELRRRAMTDGNAVAELCRRSGLEPVAA